MNEQEWRELAARQLEQFTVTTQKYRAENRRLREALERIADPCEITGDGPLEAILADPHGTAERELAARMRKAREALAGDAE